ncbi:hypothetical protein EDC94DRAFT_627861 [Helicostylum pulchrum]|nr:hypothetical protein EDC94DRAFT_627861 [Helicostylum pulchrum]
MLQDEYREHRKIGNEYQKLLSSWNNEQLNNPSTNIKRSKINKSEHAQFTLIHLFNDYLNQIWSDSKSMVQCAEAWASQTTELNPAESAFTMNIHGLHLMKQSLRKRQQLFRIVDELNSICYVEKEKLYESLCSSSDSTISQEYSTQKNLQKSDTQKIKCDLTIQKDFEYFDLEPNRQKIDSEPSRTVRLIRSPSTPTISSFWEEGSSCSQNFTPACNFSTYFPREDDTHKLSCHFCQKMVPLKKSFSVENLDSFQQGISNITDDEGSSGNDDDSSYDITSLYRYSKGDYQNDIAEREILLEDNDWASISKQYQHVNDTEDSQKIEIEHEKLKPSERVYYKKYSYPPLCNSTSYSTSRSYSETTSNKDVSHKKRSSIENNAGTANKSVRDNLSVANRSSESRAGALVLKSHKGKPDIKPAKKMTRSPSSIVRSFSAKNINLCNMFSTRKLNFTTPNNK